MREGRKCRSVAKKIFRGGERRRANGAASRASSEQNCIAARPTPEFASQIPTLPQGEGAFERASRAGWPLAPLEIRCLSRGPRKPEETMPHFLVQASYSAEAAAH